MRLNFPPQTIPDTEMIRLARLLNNIKGVPVSVAALAHYLFTTQETIREGLNQLWFAQAPITYADYISPSGSVHCDSNYTLDEAQRSLSNLRCPEHCFKPKFDGRYFKERLLGSDGENRIARLLDSMEARFGLPFE